MSHTITAIIGDTQGGSTTAVAPPRFKIHTGIKDETQVTEANALQRWLYEDWIDFWDYVRTLTGIRGKHRKNRLIIVHLGEFLDGIHHRTTQVVNEIADQKDIAMALHRPIAEMADAIYVVIGTEAHTGPGGRYDTEIAKELGAAEVDYELSLDIDGVLMDFAHHGRAGQRDWTSAAAGMATEILVDCALTNSPVPRYAFRAHNHIMDDSGSKFDKIRVVCTPSWQLRTMYGHRVAPNRKRRADIGGIIVNGDELDLTHSRYYGAPGQQRIIKV